MRDDRNQPPRPRPVLPLWPHLAVLLFIAPAAVCCAATDSQAASIRPGLIAVAVGLLALAAAYLALAGPHTVKRWSALWTRRNWMQPPVGLPGDAGRAFRRGRRARRPGRDAMSRRHRRRP